MYRLLSYIGLGIGILCAWVPMARAQEDRSTTNPQEQDHRVERHVKEPWLLTLDAYGALPLTKPQSRNYGVGVIAGASLLRPVSRWVLLGGRLRGGFLSNGAAPAEEDLRDPGPATLWMIEGVARFRPDFDPDSTSRSHGFFADAGLGYGHSGRYGALALEAGIGWGIRLGSWGLSPSLRYIQLVDFKKVVDDRDARLILAGIELTLFDRVHVVETKIPIPDRDRDGVLDTRDRCPSDAEDIDGFEDHDGCPDPDNDHDGLLDTQDQCPQDAEDQDAWDDADGCPDLDNDQDGFLDSVDACPDESEVINGIDDADGCPDSGLIAMVHDRIVFDEGVLFDSSKYELNAQAHQVLVAVVALYKQHPEWLEARIEGHADVRGSDEINQKLSQARADAVLVELVADGLPKEMLSATGYGKSRPRDTRDTPEAHSRNRRVEIVLVRRREATNDDHPDQVRYYPKAAEESPSTPDVPRNSGDSLTAITHKETP